MKVLKKVVSNDLLCEKWLIISNKIDSDDDSSKCMNTNNQISVINELIYKANFQNKNTFYDGNLN